MSIGTTFPHDVYLYLFVVENRYNALRPLTGFHLNRIESLRRPLHSCAKEEDDFAELGSPVGKDPVAIRKLMTEKPEKFQVCTCYFIQTSSTFLSVCTVCCCCCPFPPTFDSFDGLSKFHV